MPESSSRNLSIVHLSLIIPAYNEERRIGKTLEHCLDYLSGQAYESEVIVVDDGSSDRTAEIVRSEYPAVKLITYPENRGKGFAVKEGMLSAVGAYRLFYDADASAPISEIEKVWPLMDAGVDVVVGSRALPDSDIALRQPWYRRRMGRIYNVLLRCLFLTRFRDTQCGFKVMNAASTDAVFPHVTRSGYGMDCEVMKLSERFGFRVGEFPIRWLNSEDTKVRVFKDSLDMIGEVLTIRWNLMTGKYPKSP